MGKRAMWMGVRGRERWVPAPQTGMDRSAKGWSSQSQYLNGGSGVRSSVAAHREYQPTWNLASRDALRPITDMALGMHGPGPIYFIDPTAADKNVLPAQWAFPALAALGGPVLWGSSRPSTVPTESNDLDYPYLTAQYTPTTVRQSVYIPIPPGTTAWVGWHGSANGSGGLEVTPFIEGDYAAEPVAIDPLPVSSSTRVNTPFSGDKYRGLEVRFGGGTATAANIAGVMVQILARTATPQTGGFISGQGHSGCAFTELPTEQVYSTGIGADGLVGVSAKLTEVGDFR